MEQILDMHDYLTARLILQLDLQALVRERLSNWDTNNPAGGIIPKALDLLPIHLDHPRLLRNTKDLNLGPLEFPNAVLARCVGGEHAAVVRKRPLHRCGLLRNGDTIVEVQRPARRPVPRGRNHELKVLPPQVRRRVRALDAQREHRPARDVHRDLRERHIRQADARRAPFHRRVRGEVVEPVVGEVDIDGSRVLVENRADKDAWAEEELVLNIVRLRVVWVVEEQRLQGGCSVGVLLVEGRIEVIKQTVANVDRVLRRLGDEGPAVELLRDRGVAVMVAVERIECSKCGPSRAQSLSRVPSKSANVRPDHWDLEDRGKAKHSWDREPIMRPFAMGVRERMSDRRGDSKNVPEVVTEPLANLCASTGKGRASNDHRPETRSTGEHSFTSCGRHHCAVQVIYIQLQWMLGFHILEDTYECHIPPTHSHERRLYALYDR